MRKTILIHPKLFISLLVCISTALYAQAPLPDLIKDLNGNVQNSGTINPNENCGQCGGIQKSSPSTLQAYSLPGSKRVVDLSVITLDQANKLVQDFLAMKDIPFDYALDGCFARAHKMATLLDQRGITSGKAFIQGRLFASTKYGPVNWRYHVAPVVLVEENGVNVPYIIDPSLSPTAMKYEAWRDLISGADRMPKNPRNPRMPGGGVRVMENITKRFIYDVTSINSELDEYQPGDLADMDQQLAHYLELKKQLDAR